MLTFYTSLLLATLVCISPSLARSAVMEDIADGGVYCDTPISGLYELARKRCTGKTSCRISATMVATRQELVQNRCTGFFVAPVCRGTPVNIESRYDVFKTLLVSCKR